jgi:hypothetical protein
VCVVDGVRHKAGEEFESDGVVAKRLVELGVAEVPQPPPRRAGDPPEPGAPGGPLRRRS